MAGLTLKGIYKKYPGGVVAVSDVNLEIRDKEFIVLVGPSGCGKSTTLRMIAGLEEISEGELYIGDRLVNDIAPKDRDIAMVFQNYALYPHMTVFDNMAFGLKLRKVPKDEIERKVNEAAKIPVISLFAGAFFDNAGWVSTVMYFTGIILIFFGSLIINKIAGYKARKSFFIMELPEYKIPSLWGAFKSMCNRGWAYIVKAATIILLCNTLVQIMQTFNWSFAVAETADSSILASLARPFAYIIYPIVGVLSWQLAAAAVTGFIAKENVVGTLAVCFVGLENLINTDDLELVQGAGTEAAGIIAITKVAALAYLMFNLYTPPCFTALGAMNSEMKSKKWFWAGIGYLLGVGYTVGYCVYTVGTLITAPSSLNVGAALGGLAIVVVFVAVIAFLITNTNKHLKSEYALNASKA